MIDKAGKKIVEAVQAEDKNFMLAELHFLMKAFRKECDDIKALIIAQSINKYLKAKCDISNITEMLLELESYTPQTNSDDFMWELVDIRRFISSSKGNGNEAMIFSAEHRYCSAKHFEIICKLDPSSRNYCARVQEYIITAMDLQDSEHKDALTIEKTGQLLTHAEALFLQIEKIVDSIYYVTGRALYSTKVRHLKNIDANSNERFKALKSLVYYSRELYQLDETPDNLIYLAFYYIQYASNNHFSYKEEEKALKELIEWGEIAVSSGNEKMIPFLDQLKGILKKA